MTTVLSAIQTLKLDPTLRDDVGLALVPPKGDARPKDVLYAMLLSGQRIVTLARPKRHNVHPADCHLLVNTVYATKAMRESGTESWIPICLPKFAPQGFVHAHVTFIDGNVDGVETSLDLALVLVTGNKEGFSEMSAWKSHIIEKLRGSGILSRLATALNADATYSADDLAVAGLRHFVFKWRHNILATSPDFENPYSLESEAHHRLMTLYSIAHDRVLGIQERERQQEEEDEEMIKANGNDADASAPDRGDDKGVVEGSPLQGSDLRPGTPPIRPKSVLHYTSLERSTSRKATKRPRALPPSMHFLATSSEAVLAWSTMTFELYMVTSPHLSHSALVAAAKAIIKWIKAHEHELFLISTPVF
ncbi:hypothetical protein L7F22_064309 [Adiantum nelumboides]|nr:hypothetical protein [Adiantum nelumboides]